MRFRNTLFSLLCLILTGSVFAFTVSPTIRPTGQHLTVNCNGKTENFCFDLCHHVSVCEIQESYCRNCAGTQSIALKRIFDSVGTSLVAAKAAKPEATLAQILKDRNFTSLHPLTIYNYSNSYNGDQVRAQFRYLCPNLPEKSEKTGILMLGLDSVNQNITRVLGAICPDEVSGKAAFYFTNSNR